VFHFWEGNSCISYLLSFFRLCHHNVTAFQVSVLRGIAFECVASWQLRHPGCPATLCFDWQCTSRVSFCQHQAFSAIGLPSTFGEAVHSWRSGIARMWRNLAMDDSVQSHGNAWGLGLVWKCFGGGEGGTWCRGCWCWDSAWPTTLAVCLYWPSS
jgi:hypothetical protein